MPVSSPIRRTEPVELWPEVSTPDRSGGFTFPQDGPGNAMLRNVTRPTLTAYLPAPGHATGTAVVVCPGGAHHFLSVENEGSTVATWLAERGIAAYVLHYRVLPTSTDDAGFADEMNALMGDAQEMLVRTRAHRATAVEDGARAVALVRAGSTPWGPAPERVGILGFSAGAFVATATTLDSPSATRPDFLAAIYGGLWEDPVVPPDAPPAFLAWASDDSIGAPIVTPCLELYAAWYAAGRPVEAHAYAAGGHGFGMHRQGLPSDAWTEDLHAWLAHEGLLG